MVSDKLGKLAPLFKKVGGEIAEIVGGNANGAYLYAELSGGSVAAGVFHDDGEAIRYFDPTRPLNEMLLEAWETENAYESKRFAVVEYAVVGGRFEVEFQYPEEMRRGEFIDDRRERALIRRYGDRQVIYPPIPKGWTELKQ